MQLGHSAATSLGRMALLAGQVERHPQRSSSQEPMTSSSMGFTAAQTFQNILSWVNNMKGTRCQLFVGTMISRTGGGDADKDALNPLIRAGATQGLYNLIDFASNPLVGADGAYSNTTYFNTGPTHPTNAGQVLLGAEASNVINAYGNGATSAAAGPSTRTLPLW